jgi:hypothetical protein
MFRNEEDIKTATESDLKRNQVHFGDMKAELYVYRPVAELICAKERYFKASKIIKMILECKKLTGSRIVKLEGVKIS